MVTPICHMHVTVCAQCDVRVCLHYDTFSALLLASGFNQKRSPGRTLLLQIDLSQAFDRVNHEKLLVDLSNSSLLSKVVRWLNCYLKRWQSYHSQAVVDAQSNFVPNRVLGTTLPELSSFECYLFRFVCTTLAQLRSGHCRLLNSCKAHITAGMTDVCLYRGVAPHSVEHLFQCPACLTQLTTQDLWDDPDAVADFLKLDDN